MFEPLVLLSRFRVREGRLGDVRRLAAEFTDLVEDKEPRSQGLLLFLDEEGTELTYLQIQVDADAMDAHLQLAHDRIAAALELVEPAAITVYGTPGPFLREALEHNRRLGATITIVPQHLGSVLRPLAA